MLESRTNASLLRSVPFVGAAVVLDQRRIHQSDAAARRHAEATKLQGLTGVARGVSANPIAVRRGRELTMRDRGVERHGRGCQYTMGTGAGVRDRQSIMTRWPGATGSGVATRCTFSVETGAALNPARQARVCQDDLRRRIAQRPIRSDLGTRDAVVDTCNTTVRRPRCPPARCRATEVTVPPLLYRASEADTKLSPAGIGKVSSPPPRQCPDCRTSTYTLFACRPALAPAMRSSSRALRRAPCSWLRLRH